MFIAYTNNLHNNVVNNNNNFLEKHLNNKQTNNKQIIYSALNISTMFIAI